MRLLSKCGARARARARDGIRETRTRETCVVILPLQPLPPHVLRNGLSFLRRQFLHESRRNILPAPANAFSTYKSLDDADPGRAHTRASRHTKPWYHRTVAGRRLTCKSRVPHTRRAVLTGGKNPENSRKRGRGRENKPTSDPVDAGEARIPRKIRRYGVI